MRIKLDENLPASLADILTGLGHDVETTLQEGLTGRPDAEIWAAAQREGRFLITQDLDFSDIHRFTPGTHHGILLVRLRSPGRLALTRRIRDLFETENILRWHRCFVVVTDRKLRIRCPGSHSPRP
jgi:predicted nuclease of predicted toxin-antitoxin system